MDNRPAEQARRASEAANGEGAIVRTVDLGKHFGDVVALTRVSLAVRPGEVFGLIGPNGAGKSTLMRILTTLCRPSCGTAEVAGFDVVRRSAEVRRSIGYVPQLPSADRELTGYENLLLTARLYVVPARERRARVAEALELMGLTDVQHRAVETYSGGMVRRLEIAQSTLHRPKVIFLDEPTVGLDPSGRAAVWERLQRLRAQTGATVVMSTHYMEEAETLCSRIALIHRGRVAALGAPAELKAQAGPHASLDDAFRRIAEAEFEAAP
jgi:ABC-2 type transport system ATP-binding protein